MNVSKCLSENVRQLRKERGLTQEQLAEMIDSTKQMIANVENGRVWPRLENIKAIAEVLEVEETALFFDKTLHRKLVVDAVKSALE